MKVRLDIEIKPFSWEIGLELSLLKYKKTVTINEGRVDRTIKENIFKWESG